MKTKPFLLATAGSTVDEPSLMANTEIITTSRAGETVDEICWRTLGQTRDVTEQVLEMNPGLADHGPRLPGDLSIRLPSPKQAANPTRETVKLWD